MAKKKTTEAINREQEAMEEKEALPSFFTNLFSSASNPLPNRAVLEYNIMHSAPVKANTEGYRAMMKVDKRTAEDIKHRLPCITPSVQLKGNSKKLTDFRKETYWLMPIRRPRISHFRKFCFGDIFLSFGDISVSFGGIFLSFGEILFYQAEERSN